MARHRRYSTVLRQITSDAAALRQITAAASEPPASDGEDDKNPKDRVSFVDSPIP
jgi:hypothetical protein